MSNIPCNFQFQKHLSLLFFLLIQCFNLCIAHSHNSTTAPQYSTHIYYHNSPSLSSSPSPSFPFSLLTPSSPRPSLSPSLFSPPSLSPPPDVHLPCSIRGNEETAAEATASHRETALSHEAADENQPAKTKLSPKLTPKDIFHSTTDL